MSVALRHDLSGIDRLNSRIAQLTRVDRDELLDRIGATVESQVRHRIESEKSAPDGTPWAPWSDGYAESRHRGNSLLEGQGGLLASIDHQVSGDSVEIGSNLIYAAIHQFGSGDEPVQVPAHQRLIRQVFGRELSMGVWANVDAYSFLQNIPARSFLGLSPADEAEVESVVEDFLLEVLQ